MRLETIFCDLMNKILTNSLKTGLNVCKIIPLFEDFVFQQDKDNLPVYHTCKLIIGIYTEIFCLVECKRQLNFSYRINIFLNATTFNKNISP